MDFRPDYSDNNFIGARSIFASILYFILACFNYFLAFAYFAFIRELYSNHAKISSILICFFICYNLFFLIRELNFKILHWCGYHALPELVEFGSGRYSFHLPVFERHTENYKVHYSKRSISLLCELYFICEFNFSSSFALLMCILGYVH